MNRACVLVSVGGALAVGVFVFAADRDTGDASQQRNPNHHYD